MAGMHELAVLKTKQESPAGQNHKPDGPQSLHRSPDPRTAAGNLAVERLYAGKSIQPKLNISRPGDAGEQEADRTAERITSSMQWPHSPELAAAAIQHQVSSSGALYRQAAPASPHAPVANRRLEGQIDALRGGGQPLPHSVRSAFEPGFGRDFSAVQVHTGPAAAETAAHIGARAYTYGTHIAFARGEYSPDTRAGQRLLAHELTHVVQQDAGGPAHLIQRDPAPTATATTATATQAADPSTPGSAVTPGRITSFDDFEQQVFSRATMRLDENYAQLEKWRDYIKNQFDDIELKAQLAATESSALISSAQKLGRERFLEGYYSARSPADRAVDEGILNGQINDGCGECHSRQIAWRWNIRHPEFQKGPTTAEELQGLANYVTLMGPHHPGLSAQNPSAGAPASTSFFNIQPETPIFSTQAAAPAPTTIPAPPADLKYPVIKSDLCGDVSPEPVNPAPFNPKLWGPNTALAYSAIQQINPVLEPLGPGGYRVLPSGIFSTLYNRTPAELRTLVNSNIDERQGKYMGLKWLINNGHVDYKELCPIVAELLPHADPGVQVYVNYDILKQKAWDTILDILLAIVSAALILLSILFPPAILLTGTLLVGALQAGIGLRDLSRGLTIEGGIGAHVFSQQQEAAAPGLVAGGTLNIALGTLSIATSGISLARMGKVPGGGMDLAVRGPSGRFNPLADGSYIAFHPQNPDVAVILEGDQMTAGIFVNGEFKPLATAPSPWPAGTPPPGTPTWAEWAAANGYSSPGGFSGGFSGGPVRTPLALPETAGAGFFNPEEPFVFPGSEWEAGAGGGGALVPYRPGALVPYRPGALVPYRPGALVPYSPGALVPYRPGALVPYKPGTTVATPPGGSGFPGAGGQKLLTAPPPPKLLTGEVTPVVDPGGRGLYRMNELVIDTLPPADAGRLRVLQSRMPASQAELEELVALRRRASGVDLPEVAGTPEHMLARWKEYQASPDNAGLDFEHWAAGHPSRMRNSVRGTAREEVYREALSTAGTESRSAVLKTESGQSRQIDALIEHGKDQPRDMIQFKAGEESLTTKPRQSGGASRGSSSLSNEDALKADAEFIKNGDHVAWVFEERPSGPLVARARELGVDVVIRVDDAAGKARMIELMKRAGMSQAEIDSIEWVIGTKEDVVNYVVKRWGAKKK